MAPALARNLEDRAARQIEEELFPELGPIKPPARPVTRIDLREVLPSRRIRSHDEWTTARERLDQAVRSALDEGKDVDLT